MSLVLCSKVYCHLAPMLCRGIVEQFLVLLEVFTENIVNIGSHRYPLAQVLQDVSQYLKRIHTHGEVGSLPEADRLQIACAVVL